MVQKMQAFQTLANGKPDNYNPKLPAARATLAKTEGEIEKLLDTLTGANPTLLQYEKAVMSYAFNAADASEAEMEAFLKHYTETVSPLMDYDSKAVQVTEFNGMRNLILSVGGILSAMIGLIGILNFVNSMLTSIITRRREFAMLQSIGMTKRQFRSMLCLEGLYYAVGTIVLSLTLGILSSLFIVRGLAGGLWFFSYQFVIMPLAICCPIFILISLLIPNIACSGAMKESVVERLREAEQNTVYRMYMDIACVL